MCFIKEDRSQVIPKAKTDVDRAQDFTTLIFVCDGGDFSCAPDPNSFDYLHRSNNSINLNVSVINQTTVSNINIVHMFL